MTKNRRIFPSAAPEPASPLTEAPRRKRKNWRSWLTIQVESERYQPPRSGILLLQVLVGIFFFVFVTRFWYLQLHLGPEMTTQAQKNRLRTERIFAPRGRIFDDHGNILADNRTAYGLAIIREDCPDIPATLAQISQWTAQPAPGRGQSGTRERSCGHGAGRAAGRGRTGRPAPVARPLEGQG